MHPFPKIASRMIMNQKDDLSELLWQTLKVVSLDNWDVDVFVSKYVELSKSRRERYVDLANYDLSGFLKEFAAQVLKGTAKIDFLNLEMLVVFLSGSCIAVIDDYDDLVRKTCIAFNDDVLVKRQKELLTRLQARLKENIDRHEQDEDDVRRYLKSVLLR
jgi:hypothetical protein